MKKGHDAIVIGLGAMGAAALYQLAKRGADVLGIDQFLPPHRLGSSHGDTRITRQAIGEGASYTPFALRSYKIWRELESLTGSDLLTVTGGLVMGSKSAQVVLHGREDFVDETIKVALQYDILHSVLGPQEVALMFPQFRLFGDEVGYYEPMAGFLRPENCVAAQLRLAERWHAKIRMNEIVHFLTFEGNSVVVHTDKGNYTAEKVILSVGPWVKGFIGDKYKNLFTVSRQVQYWFDVEKSYQDFALGSFPIFIWAFGNGDWLYGFPAIGGPRGGLKVASEDLKAETHPDMVDRHVTTEEATAMYERYVFNRLPGLGPRLVKAVPCLYTKTPDSNFVIDTLSEHPNVIVASPCSGHGFKHSAAVGEVLSQMALGEKLHMDISHLSLKRFLVR